MPHTAISTATMSLAPLRKGAAIQIIQMAKFLKSIPTQALLRFYKSKLFHLKPQSSQAPGHLTAGIPSANIGSTNAASSSAEQQAFPSLAGMTAAEVAQALGLETAQQGKNSANPPSAQLPVRKQANGRKKRGRDIEAAVTSSGASEQQATSTVAADLTSRAGSPGVSSSTDVSPAQVQQEPGSSANTAEDEEQKRMVC